MASIKKLSPEVAARIAAGEVVERPASVIKELVENAIDALATQITVEIRRGGITLMRVTDNGKGMAEADMPLAFLRHATSKIENEEDLESVVTLGFRGEALYSIAAVAEVEILSKRKEDAFAARAVVRGGGEAEILPAGGPDGTSVTVRDLFFNTPARMKFLKKDSVEAGYIEEILRKIALARPDISFRFISGGKDIFFTPGDGRLASAVAALFGRDYAEAMLPVEYEQDGLQISGLIGKSELNRPNRSFQIFFVNGRTVFHKTFYAAIAEAYKGQIMTGRFPVCVLHINMDPMLCDVNVHPAKAEIKFANDRPVFDVIYWGTQNALYAIRDTRKLQLEKTKMAVQTEKIPQGEQMVAVLETKSSPEREEKAPERVPMAAPKKKEEMNAAPVPEPKKFDYMYPPFEKKTETKAATAHTYEKPAEAEGQEKSAVEEEKPVPPPFVRVLGQAFDTYIVAEAEGKLLLVDQHAAHERIIYNSLIESLNTKGIDSQMLLMPVSVTLSPAEMAAFGENRDLLLKSGFDAEEFGVGIVKISMVPTALTAVDPAAAFLEVLDNLMHLKKDVRTNAETHALYTIACKAALKGGKALSIKEQEALVQKAMMLDGIATCPHGRPVILSLTQKEIEKQFRRIV